MPPHIDKERRTSQRQQHKTTKKTKRAQVCPPVSPPGTEAHMNTNKRTPIASTGRRDVARSPVPTDTTTYTGRPNGHHPPPTVIPSLPSQTTQATHPVHAHTTNESPFLLIPLNRAAHQTCLPPRLTRAAVAAVHWTTPRAASVRTAAAADARRRAHPRPTRGPHPRQWGSDGAT